MHDSQLDRQAALKDTPRLSVDPNLANAGSASEEIAKVALPTTEFYLMNLFAVLVASYGLLSNSTAVVIGAMVIAVLLGPIAGIGLSLVIGDRKLFGKALLAVTSGMIEVLVVSYLIGSIHSSVALTPEILQRTQPNLFDLMIALAGGAAGAYAVGRRVPGGTMIGVAIATALVPPLASCGIAAAHGSWTLAQGAFLLFLTNFVAIQCAYSVVLYLLKIFPYHGPHLRFKNLLQRLTPSLILFLGLAVFLGFVLQRRVERQQRQNLVRKTLEEALHATPGAYLAEMNFSEQDTSLRVVASVRIPTPITPEHIQHLENYMQYYLREPVQLTVRSYLMRVADHSKYLYEPEELRTIIEEPQVVLQLPDTTQTVISDTTLVDSLGNAADTSATKKDSTTVIE